MNSNRWNPYVLLSGKDLQECFTSHFTTGSKVLMIMNKGIDVRMNIALEHVKSYSAQPNVEVLLISFDEGDESASQQYKVMVEANMAELDGLIDKANVHEEKIELWTTDGDNKRRVGDRKAAKIVDSIAVENYTDIIVDISALPRGIYFSMIGKLLTVIDNMGDSK